MPHTVEEKPAGKPDFSWAVVSLVPPALVVWPLVCVSQYEAVTVPPL